MENEPLNAILEGTFGRPYVPCMKYVYMYTMPVCPVGCSQVNRNNLIRPMCVCVFLQFGQTSVRRI